MQRLWLSLAAMLTVGAGCERPWPQPTTPPGGPQASVVVRSGHREHAGFVPTSNLSLAPRPDGCRVEVFLVGEPGRPYQVAGLLAVEHVGADLVDAAGGEEQAVAWLQQEACRSGTHAIFNVRTASDRAPYVGRSIRGTAVAVVYVGPDGAILSPPESQPRPGSIPQVAPEPEPPSPQPWGQPPPGADEPPPEPVEPTPAEGSPSPGDPEPPESW